MMVSSVPSDFEKEEEEEEEDAGQAEKMAAERPGASSRTCCPQSFLVREQETLKANASSQALPLGRNGRQLNVADLLKIE